MEAALPSRLSVTVPTAAAQAAPTMTSPKGSWRLATEKVKTVNSVSEVMKESYERKRPRGMSTMSTAESDQKNRKQKTACCSSRPTETDSLMVPSRGTENFRDRPRPAKSQSNGELLELAMQAGLTDVEGQVVMELFLLATDNEEWLNADSLKEMMRWFTLQLDEHQLKNILKDIHVKYAAETMELLDNARDDLINFKQFVWLINGAASLLDSWQVYRIHDFRLNTGIVDRWALTPVLAGVPPSAQATKQRRSQRRHIVKHSKCWTRMEMAS